MPITADLPAGREHPRPAARIATPGTATSYDSSVAVLGGTTRRGVWEIGATHTAVAVMGGVELDLTEALFTSRQTELRAFTFWGGIDITVGPRTRVVVDGVGIMGGFAQSSDEVEPEVDEASPVLRVTGVALMGGVNVKRRRPRPT